MTGDAPSAFGAKMERGPVHDGCLLRLGACLVVLVATVSGLALNK